MQRSFDFVNVSGPPDLQDAEYRRNVRVSSMRTYRRNERYQRMAQMNKKTQRPLAIRPAPPAKEEEEDRDTADTHSDQSQTSLASSHASSWDGTATFPKEVEPAALDPFNTTAMTLNLRHGPLVTTFIKKIGPILLPEPPSMKSARSSWAAVWMQQALSNELLLSAICCHASAFEDIFGRNARNNGYTETTLRLAQNTLALLQQSLRNESNTTSDETVAAVLMLMANAVRYPLPRRCS